MSYSSRSNSFIDPPFGVDAPQMRGMVRPLSPMTKNKHHLNSHLSRLHSARSMNSESSSYRSRSTPGTPSSTSSFCRPISARSMASETCYFLEDPGWCRAPAVMPKRLRVGGVAKDRPSQLVPAGVGALTAKTILDIHGEFGVTKEQKWVKSGMASRKFTYTTPHGAILANGIV